MEVMINKTYLPKYHSYKESGAKWLGQIPKHWELTRLGTRFAERRKKVSDKDYPPLSVTKEGILPQLDSAAKTNDGDNRKLVKSGDFVINSRSDRKGSSGIARTDGSVSLINIVIEPVDIHPKYCNYLLKCHSFIEEFYRMGHGIVADLWTTRYDELKAIIIGAPPLEEQTAIAQFLDSKTALIDKAIAIKQKQIELLKERRQILIHKAVTRGLDPKVKLKGSGVEWIGEIPDHWEICKLNYVSKTDTGSTPDRSKPQYWNGDIPWVKTGEVCYSLITNTEEFITESGLRNSATKLAPPGTLLLAMYGQGITRGRVAILGIPATYNQACCAIQFCQKIYNLYGYYFFIVAYNYIREAGNETSQMNLSSGYVASLKIPIPSKSEQIEIVEYIDFFSNRISKSVLLKETEIEKLKEYKSTLINSAVTGKIKVF